MLVKLRRDFFLGGHLYQASRFGVEIPEMLDGKKVQLPKDAVILKSAPEAKPTADPKMALSQMGQSKPRGFIEAMKDVDED